MLFLLTRNAHERPPGPVSDGDKRFLRHQPPTLLRFFMPLITTRRFMQTAASLCAGLFLVACAKRLLLNNRLPIVRLTEAKFPFGTLNE